MNDNLLLERLNSTKMWLIEDEWNISANTVSSAIEAIERLHAENEALQKENGEYLDALGRCRDECGFGVDDIHESLAMGGPLAVPDFVIEQVKALRKDAGRYVGLKELTYSADSDVRVQVWNDYESEWEQSAKNKFDSFVDKAMEKAK